MRPELPTASAGSSHAPTAAVDNSAPLQPARSLFISWGKTVQTRGTTSLVLSHKELVNEVAIFKTQMTQVIGFAKVQTAKHIGQSADEAAKKLIAIQTESMKSAGRELFRAEIDPPGPASEVAGEAVARGGMPHHSHGGHLPH